MAVNKVAFTAVGLACIAAAGAGGYFALRQNVAPEPTVATSAPITTPAAVVPGTPVQETESVVAPAKNPVLPEKAPKKVGKIARSDCQRLSRAETGRSCAGPAGCRAGADRTARAYGNRGACGAGRACSSCSAAAYV